MAKTIIDIEIREGEWVAFQRQVEAYRKKLGEMPHQWGAIGKAMVKASGDAAKIVARMSEQNRAWQNANTAAGKFNLTLKAADRALTAIGRGTMNVARNLKDATKSLLSWLPIMGMLSGLMGAGGLFGLSRLASSVAQGSITAMGAGASYGATKAAGIAYSPAMGEGGVTAMLNRIAEEQRSGGVMFRRLGIPEAQWRGRESADVLGPVLSAIQRKYKEGPEETAKQRMEAFAPGIDFSSILRISKLNIEGLEKEYESRKKLLDLSQGTQDSWSHFHRSLETAAERLENIFARALGGKLLGALENFTNGLLKAASMLANSPMVRKMIEGAGKGLETAGKYLTSEQFPKDLQKFVDTMGEIKDAMVHVAEVLNWFFGADKKEMERSKIQVQENAEEMHRRDKVLQERAGGGSANVGVNVSHASKIDVHVSNASGGNIIAQARGVASSTYRK